MNRRPLRFRVEGDSKGVRNTLRIAGPMNNWVSSNWMRFSLHFVVLFVYFVSGISLSVSGRNRKKQKNEKSNRPKSERSNRTDFKTTPHHFDLFVPNQQWSRSRAPRLWVPETSERFVNFSINFSLTEPNTHLLRLLNVLSAWMQFSCYEGIELSSSKIENIISAIEANRFSCPCKYSLVERGLLPP